MKKTISFIALFLSFSLFVSCSKDDKNEPNQNYDFIGSYQTYDADSGETISGFATLSIYANSTFTHINLVHDEKWTGTWTYDESTNIITMKYITETINGKTEFCDDDDFCYAYPYDKGNKLLFSEDGDLDWDSYYGWIKI